MLWWQEPCLQVQPTASSWLLLCCTIGLPAPTSPLPAPSPRLGPQAEYNRVTLSVNEQGEVVAPAQGNVGILGLTAVGASPCRQCWSARRPLQAARQPALAQWNAG